MNIQTTKLENHEQVLRAIATAIDIPDSEYENAVKKYESVGNWLERPESSLNKCGPVIYTQGSFALGTVTRPIDDRHEYDIDLVCKLENVAKQSCSMENLKEAVGNEVSSYTDRCGMSRPKNGRRCWTIDYKDNFHMDILPSVPNTDGYRALMEALNSNLISDEEILKEAIAITDKKCENQYKAIGGEWLISNPKGYQIWFNRKQFQVLNESRLNVMNNRVGLYESVDDVPNYNAKTPLQMSIQLLKRHRDIMFKDNEDNKPISMIITTLAAINYHNQNTIFEALPAMFEGMMNTPLKDENGKALVANPVRPDENFADKWNEDPQKEFFFREWLKQANYDFANYLKGHAFNNIPLDFQKCILSESAMGGVLSMVDTTDSRKEPADVINAERKARGPGEEAWRQ